MNDSKTKYDKPASLSFAGKETCSFHKHSPSSLRYMKVKAGEDIRETSANIKYLTESEYQAVLDFLGKPMPIEEEKKLQKIMSRPYAWEAKFLTE